MSWFVPRFVVLVALALLAATCAGPVAEDGVPAGGTSGPEDAEDAAEVVGRLSDIVASDDDQDPRGPDADGSLPVADPVPVTPHAVAPDPAPPVELSADEMLPKAKRLASDVVQTLLTYDADDEAAEVVERAVGEARAAELLVTAAPVLHADAWSRLEIAYPQLGGFTPTSASVMVVGRQTVGFADGEVRQESRTFDVRLAIEDDAWVFDELASAGGLRTERPDHLSAIAEAVVDDDRIELPDTARWDIYRGVVGDELLELMAAMAERTEYGVIVLDTGHPWEVFGTDRQSRHSLGRAVDVYRVGGTDVIDDREDGSELHAFVQWLYDHPQMTNMGAPWALDDVGGRSFTDDLHQDHLHIEANRRSAREREEEAEGGDTD